jgi:hypothetical protein
MYIYDMRSEAVLHTRENIHMYIKTYDPLRYEPASSNAKINKDKNIDAPSTSIKVICNLHYLVSEVTDKNWAELIAVATFAASCLLKLFALLKTVPHDTYSCRFDVTLGRTYVSKYLQF